MLSGQAVQLFTQCMIAACQIYSSVYSSVWKPAEQERASRSLVSERLHSCWDGETKIGEKIMSDNSKCYEENVSKDED